MTVYQSSRTPAAPAHLIPPGTERIEGPWHPLRSMLAQAQRSGELSIVAGPRRLPNGRGEVDVVRHRAPRSPWIARGVIGTAILAPLVALGYMVRMIVNSVAALDLTGSATGVLLVLGLLVLGVALLRRRAERRPWIEGTFRARVK